jgi:hypothetical protein
MSDMSRTAPEIHARHQRDILFVKPDYWLLMDYLDGEEQHEYSTLFHLSPDVFVEQLDKERALVVSDRNGAQLLIVGLGDIDIRSEIQVGTESPPQGWYSEDHYKKCEAPTLSFSTSTGPSASMVWLLYPLRAGEDPATVSAGFNADSSGRLFGVDVRHGGGSDAFQIVDDHGARLRSASEPMSQVVMDRLGRQWKIGTG